MASIARRIAGYFLKKGYEVDTGLVVAGGLLHDLGRARTHNVDHGVVGASMARELGLSDKIVRIIERHIGGGIPAEEAARVGLPVLDYLPISLEEKIVAYGDKLVDRGREVDISVTLGQYEKQFGMGHPAVLRLQALHDEISGIIEAE